MAALKDFTRGGYTFRAYINRSTGRPMWEVYRKRCRSRLAFVAAVFMGSDGQSCAFSLHGEVEDARPSFASACDAVMARLPIR